MQIPSCTPRASLSCSDMGELPLPALFSQLSHELAALQCMAADMEATVDDMVERHPGMLDARSIQNLQLLDILNQTLLALARFAANASALASPGWQVDGEASVAGLTLAGLAQRLSRGAGHPVRAQDEVYELFSDG
jgi:hypothetical protein